MGLVYDALGNLNSIGFFDILLPFVLFMAITYGLLSKLDIFGSGSKDKINAVISVSLAFFAVNYTTYGAQVGAYLTRLFGSGSLALSTILLFIIALQLFGFKLESLKIPLSKQAFEADAIKWGIVFAILGIGFYAFYYNGYGYGLTSNLSFLGFYVSQELVTTLVVLGILGIAVWLIMKSDNGNNQQGRGTGSSPAQPPVH